LRAVGNVRSVQSVNVRLDDETFDGLRAQVRQELGSSLVAFYEAISRLYRAGELPSAVMRQLAPLARQIDEERSAR
jgi:hypothetical protein